MFLDLPGLMLDADPFENPSRVVQALRRADASRKHIREPLNFVRAGSIDDYDTSFPSINGKVDRSFLSDFTNIEIMFSKAKPGDLVIMTPNNHYGNLLIGELTSDFNANHKMNIYDTSQETTPYREIRWIPHDLTRRDFRVEVARRLQNRRAITKIDEEYYSDVFRYVYNAYIWGNTSKLDIFGPEYNSSDPTANSQASFLIKYSIAFYAAYIADETDQFYGMSAEDAADRYFDEAIALQISQAFGSPGGYVAKLIGASAAPALAVVLAVLLAPESLSIETAIQNVVGHAQTHHVVAHSELNLDDMAAKLRAGKTEEVRVTYGRKAKANVGLTLEGTEPPELSVQRSRRRQ